MHDEQNESMSSPESPASEALDSPQETADAVAPPSVEQTATAATEVAAGAGVAGAAVAAEKPAVTELSSARMPADRGISSLALLMQLGGTVGVVFAALFALSMALSGAGQVTGPLFLVAVLSGIRSAFHRTAGTTLLYGTGSEPMRSVKTYVWLSFGQTALCMLILKKYMDAEAMAQFAVFFLGWPAAVFVFFSQKKVKELIKDGVPHAEDYGFEGAAVLMTLFGIVGTLFAGYMLKILLDDTDAAFATPASGIMVLIFIALVARSVIHTLAGLKGISGADFDECNATAGRYYNYGIVSSICIGVTLFVVVLMTAQSIGAALVLGGITTPLLLAWPQILKRLYGERNFHVYLAGSEAQTYQRAPDAGLIALGWTLIALGTIGLGFALAEALLGAALTEEELWLIVQTSGQGGLEHATRSPWWSVGVGALELWAGIELVRMSERHKLAAMIYGVVSIAVVMYLVWPAIDGLGGLFEASFDGSTVVKQSLFLLTSFPLVLAIGTIVLVNRVTVPSAVVHVRKRPGAATAQ